MNGSVVYVPGVDYSEEEKQKLLGQKYKLVVIDEAASFSINLNELVFGILKPAVTDYRGTICLMGMPGNLKKGLFFDLTTGQPLDAARHCARAGEAPRLVTTDIEGPGQMSAPVAGGCCRRASRSMVGSRRSRWRARLLPTEQLCRREHL